MTKNHFLILQQQIVDEARNKRSCQKVKINTASQQIYNSLCEIKDMIKIDDGRNIQKQKQDQDKEK